MREILFRGKRLDSDKWAYGYLIVEPSGRAFIGTYAPTGCYWNWIEVDPNTTGQYTGLTDKNGAKIFEGDLLDGDLYPFESDGEHNYFAEVIWFGDSSAFGLFTRKHAGADIRGISEGNTEYIEDFESDMWEIIGKIHDNLDLLGSQ